MKRSILFVFAALVLFAPSAFAQESLSITKSYAFATAPVQKNGAVFFEATNTGDQTLAITGVRTEASEKAELHTMKMDGDVMQMRKVEQFEIAPKGSLNLAPMSDHVMLLGLKAPLKEGEHFPLILNSGSTEIKVDVQIVAPGAKP